MASSNSSWKNLIPSSVDIKTAAETMSMIERAVFRDENSSSGRPVSANSRRLGRGDYLSLLPAFFLVPFSVPQESLARAATSTECSGWFHQEAIVVCLWERSEEHTSELQSPM